MKPAVHVETSRDLPLVSIVIGFRAGALHDPEGKDGLTRIMVRMLRRGAGELDAFAIEKDFDRLGADFNEQVGPTAVSVQLTTIRRSLDRAVGLFTKVLAQPRFDESELGKLLREAESELVEARDNDRILCSRAFRREIFAGHPLERRSAGQIRTLRSITVEDVRSQYRRVFSPTNAVFAFSGDIDETQAEQIAQQIQSALSGSDSLTNVLPHPNVRDGRRLILVDKPDRTQTQLFIGGLGTHPWDPDHLPLVVANTVFGGTFTSRLVKEVRSKRGWSYGASSSLPIDTCREAFRVWTHPKAEDAAACISLQLSLLQTWRDSGITKSELSFAKRYLVRSHAFDVDTAFKRVQQKLSVSLYELPPDYYSGYLDQVRAVTLEAANTAVTQRISLDNLIVAITGTAEQIGEAVAAAIPGLVDRKTVPHDLE